MMLRRLLVVTALLFSFAIGRSASQLLNSTIGCFADTYVKDLPYAYLRDDPLAGNTFCSQHCYKQGYKFAGTQDGFDCNCGNSYGRYGTSLSCNVACTGDASRRTICGGYFANTVMYTGLGATKMVVLYRNQMLTNATTDCSRVLSNTHCISRCLRTDSNGCTAVQYDSNSRQCCLIVDRYSPSIATQPSVGYSVWVVVAP